MKRRILQVTTVLALAYPLPGYCFFDCPFGAALVGNPPPRSTEQYCQKQDKDGNMIRHGKYTSWFPNGKVRQKAYFVNGQPDGVQEESYPNGEPYLRVVWERGKVIENKMFFTDGGWVVTKGASRPDDVGLTEAYYANGKLRARSKQKAGLNHGLAEQYDEAGKKIAEMLWENGKRVNGEEFDGDIKIAVRTDGNGTLATERYFGTVKAFSEIEYLNGTKEKRSWHRNGKLASLTVYKNGKYQGRTQNWDETGKKLPRTKSYEQQQEEKRAH